MKKVLAADLFCGALREAEFFWLTDAAVYQFVMCRTEHPEHVSLVAAQRTMRAVASKLGLVGGLQYSTLFACRRLARLRQVRELLVEAREQCVAAVLFVPPPVVQAHLSWLEFVKLLRRTANRFSRAFIRAVLRVPADIWTELKFATALPTRSLLIHPVVGRLSAPRVRRIGSTFVRAVRLRALSAFERPLAMAANRLHLCILPVTLFVNR